MYINRTSKNNLEPKKNPVIMNRYNNKYGYHTPEMTESIYMAINKEIKDGIELIDSSWHNDMVDSFEWHIVECIKYISIMLPNSFIEDIGEEMWNEFVITDEKQDILLCTKDINDVIAFLNGKYEDMLHSDALDLMSDINDAHGWSDESLSLDEYLAKHWYELEESEKMEIEELLNKF